MVGILDRLGRAGDAAGSASRGARNTDHIAVSIRDWLASADNSDTEHPSTGCNSRGQMPAPLRCGNLREPKPTT